MAQPIFEFLATESDNLVQAGLSRDELVLASPPGATITIGKRRLVNLASSDYLGLAGHTKLKEAAWAAIERFGVGLTAPPTFAATLPLHKELEAAVSKLLGTDDTLLFASAYQASAGLFESLVAEQDYVFCDEQLSPSLADGVRLARARVLAYRSNDLAHLEDRLKRSRAARFRLIVTDGVFALDGGLTALTAIHDLADRYDALVVVDDAHALGVLGKSGAGSHEHLGLERRIDVVTGTFGNALGGSGGFVSGRKEVVGWLRQKSRPYLVSEGLAASHAAAALAALQLLDGGERAALLAQIKSFVAGLTRAGFAVKGSDHPIVSIQIGDAVVTQRLADFLYRAGVLVLGFCHPVVPEGAACIRAQVSRAHSEAALADVVAAFARARAELEIEGRAPDTVRTKTK